MIRRLHILMQLRQRRRRAAILLNDLVQAGYSATDLERIAALRASVDPALEIGNDQSSDPASPTLADVLVAWQGVYGQPSPGVAQTPLSGEEIEVLPSRL